MADTQCNPGPEVTCCSRRLPSAWLMSSRACPALGASRGLYRASSAAPGALAGAPAGAPEAGRSSCCSSNTAPSAICMPPWGSGLGGARSRMHARLASSGQTSSGCHACCKRVVQSASAAVAQNQRMQKCSRRRQQHAACPAGLVCVQHTWSASVKTICPGVAWLVNTPATGLTACPARLARLMLLDTTRAPCAAPARSHPVQQLDAHGGNDML